ncbi:MAG: ParB/RepB/Spo0J family partition protein [Gammaproteobacteria bacterium SHHR-1]|uniref:ParB/RepB/Spo0J family partition protein n=1 Tax=Magnetovirga frankeli TaxID=947516 RepID=UPI001292DB12|nr:ParB/RepB/Spo0J family partition protein [gamma proteobacterium SS-5]
MALKKRGLGRGLDALLSSQEEQAPASAQAGLSELPVDLIDRGRYQPRRDFDEEGLQELANSITAQGVVQPVVVRPVEGGRYELIAGERRWRASQLAGKSQIPVVIREVDDQAAMAMGLIENIQRQDLNAVEEAGALHRLLNEFGLTHQQVADAVGKSRSAVSNLLRLLELSEEVKGLIEGHQLEMGHARALLPLSPQMQTQAAQEVVSKGLSVRQTEELSRSLQQNQPQPEAPPKTQQKSDPDVERLITRLSEKLGAQVKLQQGRAGKGRLVISYNSLEELDGILDHIQ